MTRITLAIGASAVLAVAASATAQTSVRTGPNSSATPYVRPTTGSPVRDIVSILTVGDSIGGYQMIGIPDGMGAFTNNDGSFTLTVVHELGATVASGQHAHQPTGFSGGARASSIFVSIGDNFGGVILQGAGTGILDNGLRGLSGVQIPAVVVTMGTKDGNRGEIKQLRETQGDRLQVFEFEGGHQWAPKAIVEKALDYVHAKLPK